MSYNTRATRRRHDLSTAGGRRGDALPGHPHRLRRQHIAPEAPNNPVGSWFHPINHPSGDEYVAPQFSPTHRLVLN